MIFTKVSIHFHDAPEALDTGNLLKAMIFTSVTIHFDDASELIDTGSLL